MGAPVDPVRSRLEESRKDLLDMSLRNSLLNYRHSKARGVEAVDELPAQVFRILVREAHPMSFLPVPDSEDEDELGQPDEVTADGDVAARHIDRKLQTQEPSAKLQKRLLATYYAARTVIEEQGVNTLFLALGMLDWKETPTSTESHRAPLLLVPVELKRVSARQAFQIEYTGEELGHNLSLAERLKSDFGIALPVMEEGEDCQVDDYFQAVEAAVTSCPWNVDKQAICLGFFSFAKFLMYKDLDPSVWPEGCGPADHALIRGLLADGVADAPSPLGESDRIDEILSPGDAYHVLDADSSQVMAIMDVQRGADLVIQGPPGTGKSQTIANLIADALGHQKTVLFVAEKMAALEVVKRRLDGVGLGEACLELHSYKARKQDVLEDLRRTLELGRPRLGQVEHDLEALSVERARLNRYCDAVNTPIGESGVAPYAAIGHIARIREVFGEKQIPAIALEEAAEWPESNYLERERLVASLQSQVAAMGIPTEHPFWGSRLKAFLPTEAEKAEATLAKARAAVRVMREASHSLANGLAVASPPNAVAAESLCATAAAALKLPDLTGLSLGCDEWKCRRDELAGLRANTAALANLHQTYDSVLLPQAWQQDVFGVRQALAPYADKWWRTAAGQYRNARRQVEGLCAGQCPDSAQDQLALLDAILSAQQQWTPVSGAGQLLAAVLGTHWQASNPDWLRISNLLGWGLHVHGMVNEGSMPPQLLQLLEQGQVARELADKMDVAHQALEEYRSAVANVLRLLQMDEARLVGGSHKFEELGFDRQDYLLGAWSRLSSIQQMVTYNCVAEECAAQGLFTVVALAERWIDAGTHLVECFQYARCKALYEQAFAGRPELARFSRADHEHVIKEFQRLDRLVLEHNRARLAMEHYSSLPSGDGAGQLGVLRREFQKKRRHMPLRRLMVNSGRAIQAIKPVFMMSPLSVATFVPPGSVQFDLVVFDEASQVRPTDAFGAIVRGKQTVVVGDSKQLPPTRFFDSVVELSEEEVEDENLTSDIESILGLLLSQGAPQEMLRWHYRSRHESLIAVSNREFYDNKLVVFPSPQRDAREIGLVHVYLSDTAYDRGGTGSNPAEARAVAEEVMRHARECPDLTLGVAAFSVRQMQAIQDEIERLRREDLSCEGFFADHAHEPFFVKNLENVQGDERDVMLVSIGYGRTREGYVAMSFGPVNWDGGERRLNVLMTRARQKCQVFTNLVADDIDMSRTSARGVHALKVFLEYARSRRLDVPAAADGEFGSPFEEAVWGRLTALGYEVHSQVGSAGFFIDLAIVDPEHPGGYLLGVECDGATYHSARSARDRDRLRQEVLEGLDWSIHRVWSTDWLRDSGQEVKKVVEAIEKAKVRRGLGRDGDQSDEINEDSKEGTSLPVSRPERAIERETRESQHDCEPTPAYQVTTISTHMRGVTSQEFQSVSARTLSPHIREIAAVEGPIHIDELARRIAEGFGFARTGHLIQEKIAAACRSAKSLGEIQIRGKFIWSTGMSVPQVRDRSSMPSTSKKIEYVSPEEVAAAVDRVVRCSYGIRRTSVPAEVARLLGFARTGDDIRASINKVVAKMVQDGLLRDDGTELQLSCDNR